MDEVTATTFSEDDVRRVAAGLTKASKRAIIRLTPGSWTRDGSPGPARRDSYSLWWGRDGKYGLVEPPLPVAIGQFGCDWKHRLTKLGDRVRQHLIDQEPRHD